MNCFYTYIAVVCEVFYERIPKLIHISTRLTFGEDCRKAIVSVLWQGSRSCDNYLLWVTSLCLDTNNEIRELIHRIRPSLCDLVSTIIPYFVLYKVVIHFWVSVGKYFHSNLVFMLFSFFLPLQVKYKGLSRFFFHLIIANFFL